MAAAPDVVCPACGGANAHDAVFCGNPACHKALGEFRFIREELDAHTRWHERIADRVTAFVGKPHFLVVHALWFVLWVALNSGLVVVVARFDEYPYGLLSFLLAIEAIFITGFLLISNNRQSAHADLRGELDYEVNVRTYRRITEHDALLRQVAERLERLEGALCGRAAGQLAAPAAGAAESAPSTRSA
jgi:uncharacterized membrane protein